MTIDFNKHVRTKRGKTVRILCTDMKNAKYPVVGIVTDEHGNENVQTFGLDGVVVIGYPINDDNLENVPESFYKLVYSDGYIVPQAKWMTSKAQFEIENYEKSERLGYLAQTGDGIAFEPL